MSEQAQTPQTIPSPWDVEKYLQDLRRRDAERAHDYVSKFAEKTNEAAVTSGQVAVRTFLLIDGAACVAILAFIGTLAGQGRITPAQINNVASSLLWFAWGVALATTASVLAYFVNYCHATMTNHIQRIWEHPWTRETPTSNRWKLAANILHVATILVGLASIITFIVGVRAVRQSVTELGTVPSAASVVPPAR